jgi:hypothetical protein
MMATLRAFAWFRWRVLANGLRADRRDTVEQLSRIASLIAPGILLVTSIGSVATATAGGWIAGWKSVTDFPSSVWILTIIRVLLLVVSGLMVVAPIIIGVHGGASRQTRVLLLPIPRRLLHIVEVMTALVDPWAIFLLPGLVAYALGLTIGALSQHEPWVRHWAVDGLIALVAALLVVFVLASLAALLTFLVNWLVRDRRRGELFIIVFVVCLGAAAIIPAFLSRRLGGSFEPGLRRRPAPSFTITPNEWPAWTAALPSELFAEAVIFGYDIPESQKVWPLAMLAIEGGVFFALSAVVHGALAQLPEGGRAHRAQPMRGVVAVRLPLMWPGTSAVALAQVRTALRSVRGRLVVFLPGPLVAMMAAFLGSLPTPEGFDWMMASRGYTAFAIGVVFSLYASQAFTMNQFASDRAGLTLEFLAPIRDVDLVRGKTVGCAVLIGIGIAISLICALVIAPGGSPWAWLSILGGGASTFLLVSPVAAALSIFFPVSADLSKTGSAGNPHSLAMAIGSLAIAAAAVPACLILAAFPPLTASLAMLVWTAAAFGLALPGLSLAARSLRLRRENLALIAKGRN